MMKLGFGQTPGLLLFPSNLSLSTPGLFKTSHPHSQPVSWGQNRVRGQNVALSEMMALEPFREAPGPHFRLPGWLLTWCWKDLYILASNFSALFAESRH